MRTRCVGADRGITPTIAHAPTRIVHGLCPINAGLEKVPLKTGFVSPNPFRRRALRPFTSAPKNFQLLTVDHASKLGPQERRWAGGAGPGSFGSGPPWTKAPANPRNGVREAAQSRP